MKIIAYKTVPEPMGLRPASNERQWMDETPHKYAYRCLPLQIANASGWELTAPADLVVSWNGGFHKSDLQVHFSSKWEFAASSFGAGIVTFHPGYLFKTIAVDEPKYDLLVTGLPNFFYDWMTPLTGIVETWWNPATFTMNWKLLRPGTFTIPKGSPLVFIMPIPHEMPEIEAVVMNIKDDPETFDKFRSWSKKRNETIKALEHMEKTREGINGVEPSNPSTHWEKDYFRGQDRDGKRVEDHHTKRRLPPFVSSAEKDSATSK